MDLLLECTASYGERALLFVTLVHLLFVQVWWLKAFNTSVDVLRFSPDGCHLAAGGHDKLVEVYQVTGEGLRR